MHFMKPHLNFVKHRFNFMKQALNFIKVVFQFMKHGFHLPNRPRTAAANPCEPVPISERSSPQRPENSEYSGFMPQRIRVIRVLCRGSRRRRITK